jgi:D-xylose transport system substrate-binding protein
VGVVLALAIGVSAKPAPAKDAPKVFFILPNNATIRWERRDKPFFVAAMKKRMPNAQVIVQNGEGDPARQQRLVEDAITQGAKVIVLTSSDSNLAAGELKAAADADVPVVLYEHEADNGRAKAMVIFDPLAVGRAQGKRAAELINKMVGTVRLARIKGQQGTFPTRMYEKGQNEYLDPLIKSGKVKVVCSDYTPNWDPVKAQTFAENCLTRTGGKVDMFLGMNDGTAGAAVAALISQGFKKGQVMVAGGQDATIEAAQYILQGWQDDTVYKDLSKEADAAANIVVSILQHQKLPAGLVTGKFDNGAMEVPTAFLPVQIVALDNIGMLVKDGLYTWKQMCKGAEDTPMCKAHL